MPHDIVNLFETIVENVDQVSSILKQEIDGDIGIAVTDCLGSLPREGFQRSCGISVNQAFQKFSIVCVPDPTFRPLLRSSVEAEQLLLGANN
jgi:hypothetical protein